MLHGLLWSVCAALFILRFRFLSEVLSCSVPVFIIIFRLKPDRPITIHQKALFCSWMIIIFLCIVVKLSKIWRWILSKWRHKEKSGENEDNVESQKQMEHGAKVESTLANEGIVISNIMK